MSVFKRRAHVDFERRATTKYTHGRELYWSDVTHDSAMNHNYVRRPVDAHANFFAYWADGNPDKLSPSRLYFCNRAGNRVWRLPYDMSGDFAKPEPVSK